MPNKKPKSTRKKKKKQVPIPQQLRNIQKTIMKKMPETKAFGYNKHSSLLKNVTDMGLVFDIEKQKSLRNYTAQKNHEALYKPKDSRPTIEFEVGEERIRKMPYTIPEWEWDYLSDLHDKYQLNYHKMARDIRVNFRQFTPAQLEKKFVKFLQLKAIGEERLEMYKEDERKEQLLKEQALLQQQLDLLQQQKNAQFNRPKKIKKEEKEEQIKQEDADEGSDDDEELGPEFEDPDDNSEADSDDGGLEFDMNSDDSD
eukprot:TRINITY_DN938_c0_g1_i1.p1 TRINITY_DN938_c0_g1~~TRINITY_DN938_c0_g1_i1.p1  ORF type:complete len:256 (+),score=73.06 TRINITY_DN938_c0_g1_i1:95-862(+)